MTHTFHLSHTAEILKRSVMRDLIALASKPEIISFAGGLPAADCLPLEEVQLALETVLTRDGSRALQYGPPFGPLKEWIAGYMRQRGIACATDDVFITNGAQQALEIVSRLFIDPGTPAVLESLTFTGVAQAVQGHGGVIRSVPLDLETGVDVEALEAALAQAPRPRLAIIIPEFHNPSGVSLIAEKRQRVAELAARYNVPVLEDDPYSPLRYEGEALRPIKAYDDADSVIYQGSFSKMLAPAMRLGWIVAPRELLPRLTVLRESIDLESSQLLQRTAAEFLTAGYLEPHLQRLNATNLTRRNVLFEALQHELGGLAQWTAPQGGLFVWVTFNQASFHTGELFAAAIARQVAYVPGMHFSTQGGYTNTMRFNYSNATPDRITEGIRRLGEVVREQLAVLA